ncbi:MAG: beta-propeller domain-containing protein, partial [Planctomycetota bacterium]
MRHRKRQGSKRRHGSFQSLEQRLNLSVFIDYGYSAQELNDDGSVVSIESLENPIAVLANDAWNLRRNYEDGQITLTQPDHGHVRLTTDGTVLYTPDAGFQGIDRFSYSHTSVDAPANVYVNVIQPVFALRDWFRVENGSSNQVLDVLRNDSINHHLVDQDQSDLRIVTVTQGDQGGSIVIADGGRELIYTPANDSESVDTFRYTIENPAGFSSEASVVVQALSTDATTSRQVLPEQFKQIQFEAAAQRYSGSHGSYRPSHLLVPTVFADIDLEDRSSALSVSFTSTTSSTTNNQHSGVDEGAVVKTDGEFLYVASNWTDDQGVERHELIIGDVRDPTAPTISARVGLDGDLEELHLLGDRVVTISTLDGEVAATVLDVAERTNPEVVFESTVAGVYEQSRLVGDHVYLVVATASPLATPMLEEICFENEAGCFYETAEQYLERVTSDADFGRPPEIKTFGPSGAVVSTLTPIVEAAQTATLTGMSASTLVSLDLSNDGGGVSDVYSFLHDPNTQIYASPQAFYFFSLNSPFPSISTNRFWSLSDGGLFARPASDSIDGRFPSTETIIEKVAFDDGQLHWAASGTVQGAVANPFSLSEHNGYLRVASNANGNSVFVMAEDGGSLDVIGSVEGLAYGEQIYSVRFQGDRGFVVTYRKVDPLFVIDFTDPASPELLGELKITGYSNYLHVIDENHLLGIGREADGAGLFQEMQVTLFDISDLENPQLKHRYSFEGGRSLWSPIMRDAWNLGSHQSVSYFAEHQTLVIPFYEGDHAGWSWVRTGGTAEVSMRVLDIDLDDGINVLGTVDFEEAFEPHLARSVRIGDALASVSPTSVFLHELRDPDQALGRLLIESEAADDELATRGSDRVTIDVLQNDR